LQGRGVIKWTTKGKIEVRRGGLLISSHVSDREAWESISKHSDANGAGKYVVSYPNVEVDVVPITIVSTDTQAPTQPQNFQVLAPPEGGLYLQWSPSTDGPPGPSGGSGLRGYRIWRALTPAGPFTQIALVEVGVTQAYADYSMGEGQSRAYFIDAIDNAGNVSAPTAIQSATSLDITPPSNPVITAAALGATAIQITLATPSVDASQFAYTLEYKRSVDSTWLIVAIGLNNASFPYLVSSLTASTNYDFRMKAIDTSSNVSLYSPTASAQTQSGGPASLRLWRAGRTTVGLFASQVPGAHYYKIRWRQAGTSGPYTYAQSPAQWLVAVGLTTGVSYDFQYLTTNAAGVEAGTWSNVVTAAPVAGKVDLAEAPRVYVDTTYVAPTGTDYVCNNVAQVQAALAACAFGDSITLNAANTFDFSDQILPNRGAGASHIHIRSSLWALLPGPGVRVGPEHSGFMPKLRCAIGANSIFASASAAHHFRLLGLDLSNVPGNQAVDTFLYLDNRAPLAANTAHHMIVDRCYMHTAIGDFGTYGVKRCVSLGGIHMAVVDSYLDHQGPRAGTECHAIAAFGGAGPLKIRNNFLQASSINVLIGGAAPEPSLVITKDIEVWGNLYKKNPAWKYLNDPGGIANVKNLLEFKWGQRCVSGGGVFDTNWAGGQAGESILIGLQGEGLSPEWNKCTDIAFYDIDGKDWCGGFQLTERSNSGPPPDGGYHDPAFDVERVTICNVRAQLTGEWANGNLDGVTAFHPSRLAPHDLLIDHATFGIKANARTAAFQPVNNSHALNAGAIQEAITAGVPYYASRVRYTTIENSIIPHGAYGISGGVGFGKDALNNIGDPACPWSVKNTVLFDWAPSGVSASAYGAPMVNVALPNLAAVGFTNYAAGDYTLQPSSPYKSAGTDGLDIGYLGA
jgi:hypothetical protein